MKGIQKIEFKENLLGIIIRGDYSKEGVDFFTPNDFAQQMAFMKHPKGKKIDAHVHNKLKREILVTQEVLIIRKGKLRVDFYEDNKNYICSYVLNKGDIILLASGGHGFECLDDVEMIEIKQGPYLGDKDKIRFASIEDEKVEIK